MKVFISYHSSEERGAQQIAKLLKRNTVDYFLASEKIKVGAWHSQMLNELKSCDLMLVLINRSALKSSYVNQELGVAFCTNVIIIPLLIGVSKAKLPPELRILQCRDLSAAFESHKLLAKLVKEIASGQLLGSPPPMNPPPANAKPDWREKALGKAALYTFYGLREEARSDRVFQSFAVSRAGEALKNPNPLGFAWFDSVVGGQITAKVEPTDPPQMTIAFFNGSRGWPSNASIRPENDVPVITEKYETLVFEARVSGPADDAESLSEVFVAIRLVDRYCQHWYYGREDPRPSCHLMKVARSWAKIRIPFRHSKDWWLFNSDGNYAYGPQKPDFSVIPLLWLELGGPNVAGRPGPGRGSVSIRAIQFE